VRPFLQLKRLLFFLPLSKPGPCGLEHQDKESWTNAQPLGGSLSLTAKLLSTDEGTWGKILVDSTVWVNFWVPLEDSCTFFTIKPWGHSLSFMFKPKGDSPSSLGRLPTRDLDICRLAPAFVPLGNLWPATPAANWSPWPLLSLSWPLFLTLGGSKGPSAQEVCAQGTVKTGWSKEQMSGSGSGVGGGKKEGGRAWLPLDRIRIARLLRHTKPKPTDQWTH
jgi:hypothetical protein